MFKLKIGKPYEWRGIFDKVKNDVLDIDKKDKKRFQDAAYAVNKKVKLDFKVNEDLFSFHVPKHITRNF
jgi:predicted nucleotidyltransferase